MPSLAELKKNRVSQLEKLKNATQGNRVVDERFWAPTFDKEKGKGSAVVRFLPAPSGEDLAFVRVYRHNFKGPEGKYYSELSRTTLTGEKDPCQDLCNRLWNSGIESDKKVRQPLGRKTTYYSNVLVLSDPANPENEGKVFIFRFGPQIYEIVSELLFPKDEEPVFVYDAWDGRDFKINIKGKVLPNNDIVPDYSRSMFSDDSTPLADSDDEIEEIWGKAHSLKQFSDVSLFKTFEELQAKLFDVLGSTIGSGLDVVPGWKVPTVASEPVQTRSARNEEVPSSRSVDDDEAPAPKAKKTVAVDDDDDDDDLEFLRSLRNKK